MKAEWYYTQGGQQLGPFTAADLKKFAEDGKLKPEDLVWKEGMANWVAAKAVKGIFPAVAAAPAPVSRPAGIEPAGATVTAGPADDFAYEAPGKRIKPIDKAPVEDSRDGQDDQEKDFDDRPVTPQREPGGFVAYLTFRKMIVPVIIQIIFWTGVLASLAGGGFIFFSIAAAARFDILAIVLGALGAIVGVVIYILIVRIYCELLIVSFRILSTLVEIKELLQKRQ